VIVSELAQALWRETITVVALAPTPTPAPVNGVNTDKIIGFFVSNIVPILLAVLGIIFIGRASKGEISKVLTSSAIAIVGLAFIAGAGALFFFGEYLVNLIFG
jgi:small-conductance mechanosensitive channel